MINEKLEKLNQEIAKCKFSHIIGKTVKSR